MKYHASKDNVLSSTEKFVRAVIAREMGHRDPAIWAKQNKVAYAATLLEIRDVLRGEDVELTSKYCILRNCGRTRVYFFLGSSEDLVLHFSFPNQCPLDKIA